MQDFQNAAPAKMHSRLLADKMKHLKSFDEDVCKMCNIIEEYVAERMAEAKAEATNNTLKSIRKPMQKTHWSAEEAMMP